MEQCGKAINELQLFHGTRDDANVPAIARQNFDFRLAGVANATVYGHGAYFAQTAAMSDTYAKVENRERMWMFLARAIIGRTTVGTRDMLRPPLLNPKKPEEGLFDSCSNSISNPQLYVVFDSDQCYPEYVISYTRA